MRNTYLRQSRGNMVLREQTGEFYFYNCRNCNLPMMDKLERLKGYCENCKPQLFINRQSILDREARITEARKIRRHKNKEKAIEKKLTSKSKLPTIEKIKISKPVQISSAHWIPRDKGKSKSEIEMQERIERIVENAKRKEK